jgi:hypothetical protein
MRRIVETFVVASLLAACGGEPKPVTNPEPQPVPTTSASTPTEPVPTATATAAPTATTPPEPPKPPPAPALKDTLGEIKSIDVAAGKTKKPEITKAADVDAVLKAIGLDQTAEGALRKCPDDLTLSLKDKDKKVKGMIGLCNAEGLGPEFWTEGGERKGIKVSDEAGLRKILKLAAPKAAKPPAPAGTAKPKK